MCVCAPARAPPRALLRLAVLALLAASLAQAERPKRAEMSPVPFVMGSRYGRSPERVMAPRNDRFFMGSRYGKRSQADSGEGGWEGCAGGACLLCVPLRAAREPQRPAARSQLYKCVPAPTPHYASRRMRDVVRGRGH